MRSLPGSGSALVAPTWRILAVLVLIGMGGLVEAVAAGPQLYVTSALRECGVADDDTVRIDIGVGNLPITLDAGGVDVTYDSTVLAFVGCEPGDLTAAWSFFDCADLGNRVRVGGFDLTGVPPLTNGIFATLIFVSDCCGSETTEFSLCPTNLVDDLETVTSVVCGRYFCASHPSGTLAVTSAWRECDPVEPDTVAFDVRLVQITGPIDAAGVDITYDPSVLAYAGFEKGDLVAAWQFVNAVDLGAGRIRVGAFDPVPIPGGSTGTFVRLRFLSGCCSAGHAHIALCPVQSEDDFIALNTACGDFRCLIVDVEETTWGRVKALYR